MGSAPQNYGENITMLGALSAEGLSALMTVDGATDGDVFTAFVREVLAPTLKEGDIVVLDNLGAHRSASARRAVEARGARLQFLPPYSPDMNPIERCWSKIKTALRAAKARTREALEAAIKQAMMTVSASDARACSNTRLVVTLNQNRSSAPLAYLAASPHAFFFGLFRRCFVGVACNPSP